MSAVTPCDDGLVLRLYIQPKASRDSIVGLHGDEVKVAITAPPVDGQAARVAWHGWAEGDATTRLDVIHAWLFEDLPGGRVRILTQESQIGVPAQELARTLPNPMINGHQEWITGLARAARDA